MAKKKINKNDKAAVRECLFYSQIETAVSLFFSFLINMAVIATFAYWYSDDKQIDLQSAAVYLEEDLGSFA